MRTARTIPYVGSPWQRPASGLTPWTDNPWIETPPLYIDIPRTETPLDKDPPREQNHRKTGVKTITFPQLRLRAVNISGVFQMYQLIVSSHG